MKHTGALALLIVLWTSTMALAAVLTDDATGGDCPLIGTWDASTKTCVMSADVTEWIRILDDGITLDCDGHTIDRSIDGGPGAVVFGVSANGVSGVTVRDCLVRNAFYGIVFSNTTDSTIAGNSIQSGNATTQGGVRLEQSSFNTIDGNTLDSGANGIVVRVGSVGNLIRDNVLDGLPANNNISVGCCGSTDNIVTGNFISNNAFGVSVGNGADNTIVQQNVISNITALGINIGATHDGVLVLGNTLTNVTGFAAINVQADPTNAVVAQNRIVGATRGIVLGNAALDTLIERNRIRNVMDGIHAWGVGTTVSRNDVLGASGFGIRVFSDGHVFQRNKVCLSGILDIEDAGRTNTWIGNRCETVSGTGNAACQRACLSGSIVGP